MDDFSFYDDTFKDELYNLEKKLFRCWEAYLSLSNERCRMLSKEGIVLGYHISSAGIKVDLSKIKVIMDLPAPQSQKDVISFFDHYGYYRRFIEKFTKISTPMSKLLVKYINFVYK
jgi:hypothetical protein